MQQTTQSAGTEPEPASSTDQADDGLARRKLNAVRDELRRAELAFLAAKQVFGDANAREAAGKIADALGRASRAIDSPEKGAAVHAVVQALAGASRFDPAWHPVEFAKTAAWSVGRAGRMMAGCGFPAVAYWGRTLIRMAGAFAAMKDALTV